MVCEKIGEADPDVAGVGILVSFFVQTFVSLALSFWVFFLSKLGRLKISHERGSEEYKVELGRWRIISRCIMVGNDVQLMLGIALIIFALAGIHEYDFYHLRLIYDLVSFVGVGCTACSITWTYTSARVSRYKSLRRKPNRVSRWSPRHRALYLFAILFTALVILVGIRVGDWNEEEQGHCYLTDGVSGSNSLHPSSDIIYVSITSVWLMVVLLCGTLGNEKQVRPVLIGATLQYPAHLYFMIAVRKANSGHLEGTKSESDWRFGQTTAVVLLGATLVELLTSIKEYINFEKKVEAHVPIEEDPETTGDVRATFLQIPFEAALKTGKRIVGKQRSRQDSSKSGDITPEEKQEHHTTGYHSKESMPPNQVSKESPATDGAHLKPQGGGSGKPTSPMS